MKLISGIYIIRSKSNPSRIYVGSSKDISKRWSQHLTHLRTNKHFNKKLQNHFNKYGLDDLEFSVLEQCDIENLHSREQFYINNFQPFFNIQLTVDKVTRVKKYKSNSVLLKELLETWQFPLYDRYGFGNYSKDEIADCEIFFNKMQEIKDKLSNAQLVLLEQEYKLRYSTHKKYRKNL